MPNDIRLDAQAAALLKQVQKQLGPVQQKVEEQIAQACPAQTQAPGGASGAGAAAPVQRLGAEQLAQILIQAMPDQAAVVKQAKDKALCYHPDGKNAKFLTQLLDLRIEKEFGNIYVPQPPPPRTTRDPYYTTFAMDPKADFVLLFNARDVDRNGEPLLMKIVARERADVEKLDLGRYRLPAGKATLDVSRVPNDADFVEVKDTDEAEFEFGDPLKQVSLGAKGQELSTSVKVAPTNQRTDKWYYGKQGPNGVEPDLTKPYNVNQQPQVGDHLDVRPVVTFDDRARVITQIDDSFARDGGWLQSKLGGTCKVALAVERGFAFEPGAEVTFRLADGTTGAVKADPADAQLLGTPSLNLGFSEKVTLQQALTSPVSMGSKSVNPNQASKNLGTGVALLGAYPADLAKVVSFAGKAFVPLGSVEVASEFAAAGIKIDKRPLENDPEQDGQRVRIALDPSFAKVSSGSAIKDWKVVAGYTDDQGKWHGSPLVALSKDGANGNALELQVDVADAPALLKKNGKLEIRIFNPDNVPAQSVQIPLRAVKWAPDA